MGVEIKQLTVKSMVTSGGADNNKTSGAWKEIDVERLKEQILNACREQVEQMLNDSRNR